MADKKQRQKRLVEQLIRTKVSSQLSNKQLIELIETWVDEDSKSIAKLVRKELDNGYCAHRLHGCTTCNDFVWLEHEKIVCHNCNHSRGRYDDAGNPLEEVFYFALLPRLETMYRDAEWRHSLLYPETRPRRVTQRSDVFDGTEYKRLRRTVGRCDHFVAFAHVADAVSANKKMSRSILPIMLRLVPPTLTLTPCCVVLCCVVCVWYRVVCVLCVVCVCVCVCVLTNMCVCARSCVCPAL